MDVLKKLPNIGVEIEKQLHQIGIRKTEDLKQLGSQETWLKIQAIDPSACYNKLLSLEGAVQGVNKKELTLNEKKKLKNFYYEHKRSDSIKR